jgi:hypothetical protein
VPLACHSIFNRHCERSEAISKGIDIAQQEIASGYALLMNHIYLLVRYQCKSFSFVVHPPFDYFWNINSFTRNDEWLWLARVGLLRAPLSLRQSPRRFAPRGSAGGSLRSPPPSASLTQSTNYRWWLFTLSPFGAERKFSFPYLPPSPLF